MRSSEKLFEWKHHSLLLIILDQLPYAKKKINTFGEETEIKRWHSNTNQNRIRLTSKNKTLLYIQQENPSRFEGVFDSNKKH